MNNNRQKTTESTPTDEVFESGLTPNQERAAVMLASGESITSVAEALGVNRTTIYQWQQKVSFRCYFNIQKQEVTSNLQNGLLGLYEDALTAIKSLLESSNDVIKLKAAMLVINKVESTPVGETDAKEVLRKEATSYTGEWNIAESMAVVDQEKYKKLLVENGFNV